MDSGYSDLIRRLAPPPRRVSMMYSFEKMALEPGEERSATVDVKNVFRASKLHMFGEMDEIRGHYWIKRSHLPHLNRDDVVAYTRVYRTRRGFRPGKTVVEFSGFDGGAREYLASSVEYIHTDPLEYVQLRQLFIGKEPTLPSFGIPAQAFGTGSLGNCLPLPTTDMSATILLKNVGDIQVRVHAALMGVGLAQDSVKDLRG